MIQNNLNDQTVHESIDTAEKRTNDEEDLKFQESWFTTHKIIMAYFSVYSSQSIN